MTRLIDTMTDREVHNRLSPFFDYQLLFRGTAELAKALCNAQGQMGGVI